MKVLMVCLGNICRSPLAEGILKSKIDQAGLDWQLDSAGTGAWHSGELPDPRSIETARKHGIDITNQRARQVSSSDFKEFDLIFAMDASNYNNLLKMADETDKAKIKLILNQSSPGRNAQVPDPYYDNDGFENVYQMLDKACDCIIENYSE